MKIEDPILLIAMVLTAILLALMIAPRPDRASETFAEAFSEHQQSRKNTEVESWLR